uniref:Transposase (Putative), gypsy type n=1 Tax=Tanacetum cinerariifolium TaxID=118510 RepID=A0A6L2MUS5_TANCI|nr:hypothetical protein [Tanacetum cinerariifolium]
MGRDTVQLETTVNTISEEYLLEFTSEYGIPEALHPELLRPEDRIVDFPEGKVGNNRFFWVDERVFPTAVDWRMNAPKDGMPAENTYSMEAVRALDTHRTPIQKQPKMLLCLLEISHRYYLGDEVYLTFLHDDDRDMDLFNLIRAPNPTKVNIGSRPRAAHEVPLLTMTANRVIEMEDPAAATDSSGVPSTIERSPLDFVDEAAALDHGVATPEVPSPEDMPAVSVPEVGQAEEVIATAPSAATEGHKRGRDGADVNAPAKVLRKDHADPWPTGSTRGGKSLAAMELGMASTRLAPVPESAPVSDPDPLSFANPPSSQGTDAVGDPESKNASFSSAVGSSESIYRPEWGVANGSLLDTPEACQDLVDHVAMGSQLRLRFEQEAKLLRKSVAQVARRDKRIQAREYEIKNVEALLEVEAGMKKAAEDKSAGLSQGLEDMRARFLDLQVSNEHLSHQVATLQEQVSGEEKLKAAFKEFKRYEDNRVIGRGLRLAIMKCDESLELRQAFADVVSVGIAKGMSEGLRHGVEHRQAQLSLESIEAYDPEAEPKYVTALQELKDLKYPLVDQLEGLKDAPMEVIMASMYLDSDIGDDAPQHVRDLCPSSSQLTIPLYPEVRDPMNPWACKEEMLLADAIAANINHAEKKKKCRIVCCTHGVGSAHHARSDGVPVSVPTVVPQGLAILLADAATQAEFEKDT